MGCVYDEREGIDAYFQTVVKSKNLQKLSKYLLHLHTHIYNVCL